MSFLWIDFSAQIFGKMVLNKIQDGVRFKISLQKSLERKILLQKSLCSQGCRLQARLKIMKFKNFLIWFFFNLSKTLNFQNSLKIWVFILETYVQRKSCYKLHKESQKNWLESENPWFRPLAGWQILTSIQKTYS
jgi:hypothetical protein